MLTVKCINIIFLCKNSTHGAFISRPLRPLRNLDTLQHVWHLPPWSWSCCWQAFFFFWARFLCLQSRCLRWGLVISIPFTVGRNDVHWSQWRRHLRTTLRTTLECTNCWPCHWSPCLGNTCYVLSKQLLNFSLFFSRQVTKAPQTLGAIGLQGVMKLPRTFIGLKTLRIKYLSQEFYQGQLQDPGWNHNHLCSVFATNLVSKPVKEASRMQQLLGAPLPLHCPQLPPSIPILALFTPIFVIELWSQQSWLKVPACPGTILQDQGHLTNHGVGV